MFGLSLYTQALTRVCVHTLGYNMEGVRRPLMPANYPVKGLLFLYIPMVCGYLPRKPRLHFNLKLQLYTYRAVDIRLSLQRYSPSLVEFG